MMSFLRMLALPAIPRNLPRDGRVAVALMTFTGR
jgi:hypothetical protein